MFSKTDIAKFSQTFDEQGYLIFKGVVPRDRLTELKAQIFQEFEDSKRSGRLFAGGGQISGHLNCFPGEASRFTHAALEERGVIAVISQSFTKNRCRYA